MPEPTLQFFMKEMNDEDPLQSHQLKLDCYFESQKDHPLNSGTHLVCQCSETAHKTWYLVARSRLTYPKQKATSKPRQQERQIPLHKKKKNTKVHKRSSRQCGTHSTWGSSE